MERETFLSRWKRDQQQNDPSRKREEGGKGNETKERERDGWRNMWGMYVRTRKRREINSHGLRGIGRAEFILRIRRIFLSRCNCNDDLYKRIDFLPRISPGQRPEQESIILSMYLLFKNVRALFSSRQFFTDRESFKGWRTDISMLDFYTLYIYTLSKNGFDESSAKV